METTKLNLPSEEELTQMKKSVNEVFSGIGDKAYQTAIKQFFSDMGDMLGDNIALWESMIRKLSEMEVAYEKLRKAMADDPLQTPEFAEQSSFLSEETAKSKAGISLISGNPLSETLNKDLDAVITANSGFFTKLTSLYENYNKDILLLNEARKLAEDKNDEARILILEETLKIREQKYKESINKLLKEAKGGPEIFTGDLMTLSFNELAKGIKAVTGKMAELKTVIDKGEASETQKALYNELEKVKEEAEKAKSSLERMGEVDLGKIGGELGKIASSLSETGKRISAFDSSLGGTITTVSTVLSGAGEMATGLASVISGKDIIGGTLKTIQGIADIVKGIKTNQAENKKIRQQHEKYLLTEITKESELNAIMRERLRLGQRLGEIKTGYFARMDGVLNTQKDAVAKEFQSLFGKLGEEDYVAEQKYKHGTWFRRAKVYNELGSLKGKSYEEIELLNMQGKLTENAKLIFERLQKLKEEGVKIDEEIQKLQEEAKQAWTGTTQETIVDSIARGFMDGKKSAQDFADDFEGLMKNAMLQAIKMRFLEDKLNDWYNDFAEKSESDGTLTEEEILELEKSYNSIIADAVAALENMEAVTGKKFGAAGTEATSVAQKGFAAAMSQDSANELNGRFYALQMIAGGISDNVSGIQKTLVDASVQWLEIAENTRYCRKLETMEKDMGSMKNDINSMALKGIRLIR
ncbi:MAG: hypothetical protein LBV32_01690 [Tannerellaceae bacterium]|nr:hypothetical protein [Tannerellaceae bacterium]